MRSCKGLLALPQVHPSGQKRQIKGALLSKAGRNSGVLIGVLIGMLDGIRVFLNTGTAHVVSGPLVSSSTLRVHTRQRSTVPSELICAWV